MTLSSTFGSTSDVSVANLASLPFSVEFTQLLRSTLEGKLETEYNEKFPSALSECFQLLSRRNSWKDPSELTSFASHVQLISRLNSDFPQVQASTAFSRKNTFFFSLADGVHSAYQREKQRTYCFFSREIYEHPNLDKYFPRLDFKGYLLIFTVFYCGCTSDPSFISKMRLVISYEYWERTAIKIMFRIIRQEQILPFDANNNNSIV